MADPLSLPAEDLDRWLQANPAGSTPASPATTPTPTPATPTTTNAGEESVDEALAFLQTGAQLGGAFSGQNAPLNLRPPPQGIERFTRPGFDLDVTTGAPFSTRLRASFAPTDQDKLALYRNAFSGSQVEMADGNIIVRNVLDPATGVPKDMLVDEQDVSVKDVADLADAGVQGLAELFVLRGMGRLTQGLGRLTRVGVEAGTGAATANAVGAAADTLTRLVEGQPLELAETARRRSRQSVIETGLAAGLGSIIEAGAGTFDAVTGRATGALAPGSEEKIAIAALQDLNRTAPEPILPTLGQISANPDVLRFETVMAKMPIIGRLFRAPLEQQETALRRLQEQQLSNTPLRPLDELGAETVETLRASVNRPVQAATAAQTSLITRATDELETALNRIAPAAQPFTAEGATALTKLAARNQHAAFRQRANELFEAAGDPILDTSRMNRELARIRDELPKRTVVSESELIDLQGRPLATTEGRVINRELVPAKLNRLMRGLDQLDPQMPLSELRRIRSLIDDAMIETRGLSGAEDRELANLREAVTRTIDDGIRQLGDTDTAQRLARANQFYREGIDRFEVPLVSRLLKEDPNQPGFIGAFELLNTIQRDPDSYRNLERFARSAVVEGGQAITPTAGRQFNILRRTLLEELFSRARTQPGQRVTSVDADVVMGELHQLKPEVRASLLGGEARTIDRNLELLSQLKTGYKDVPEDALRNFLNRPNNSVQDLSKLATAVRQQRLDFENGLLKKFLGGEVGSEALSQPQVVDWLLGATKPGEVADVMARLGDNPQLVESLRQKFLVGVLQKARAPLRSADAARIDDPTEVLSPAKLTRMLKDENQRRVFQTVLGNDAFNFIENYTKAQALLGKHADSGATTAGGLAATAVLLDIFKLVRNAPTVAKHVIFATAMTNRGLRQAIMEQSLRQPLDTRTFTRVIMSSTPMIEALGDEFGTTGAGLLLQFFQSLLEGDETPPTP